MCLRSGIGAPRAHGHPFHCVDKINQGPDECNERLVFKRIIENSTQPPRRGNLRVHSGQYFLITPKLLPNLVEMEEEAVTILNIFNRPFGLKKLEVYVKATSASVSGGQSLSTCGSLGSFSSGASFTLSNHSLNMEQTAGCFVSVTFFHGLC